MTSTQCADELHLLEAHVETDMQPQAARRVGWRLLGAACLSGLGGAALVAAPRVQTVGFAGAVAGKYLDEDSAPCDRKFCSAFNVSLCPAERPLLVPNADVTEGECAADCCAKACSSFNVSKCPAEKPGLIPNAALVIGSSPFTCCSAVTCLGGFCNATCPTGFGDTVQGSPTLWQCVAACPPGSFQDLYNKVCVASCPGGYGDTVEGSPTQGQCVAECLSPAIIDITNTLCVLRGSPPLTVGGGLSTDTCTVPQSSCAANYAFQSATCSGTNTACYAYARYTDVQCTASQSLCLARGGRSTAKCTVPNSRCVALGDFSNAKCTNGAECVAFGESVGVQVECDSLSTCSVESACSGCKVVCTDSGYVYDAGTRKCKSSR